MNTAPSELVHLSDQQLLVRFHRLNDGDAFAALISRHGPMVMRICKRISVNQQDAEDAFQAVFFVLARKSRSIAWQNSIANWLYGVAWRISKSTKRRVHRQQALLSKIQKDDGNLEFVRDESVFEEVENLLYPALYRLPSRYRTPIILCHLEGKSRSEAAKEMGVTESVIKGLLERGREQLRKSLASPGTQAMALFASGSLATQVVEGTPLPSESLAMASSAFATRSAVIEASSTCIALANGELAKMSILFQLKMVSLVLALTSIVGASTLLLAQTKSTGNGSPQSVEAMAAEWKRLDPSQQNQLTLSHLKAIMNAIHRYADDHQGMLPPAVVANPQLPPEKRLSGFVLLLPYLNAKPIYDQIDLTKSWDDPANSKAAQSIVPEFLSPDEETFFNPKGMAVSHFALVRGSQGKDNGMFPLVSERSLSIADIRDGTSATLAVGQIHSDFGPWIASGPSTARSLTPTTGGSKNPGFGSQHQGGAHFANGDGFTYFLDMSASRPELVQAIAGRDDGILVRGGLARYPSVDEWKKAKQTQGKSK